MALLRWRILRVVGAVLGVLLLSGAAACASAEYADRVQPAPEAETITPLKIGLLMSFGEGVPERDLVRRRSFELAIKHINAAGGVFGRPVEVVIADSTLDPAVAVSEARRLVEVEGVHAIVGPGTSANTLPVAEVVAGPARIPIISPSATSPLLTRVADNDFLFRVALSDTAQGPVLARVTRERGFTNVGVIYRDDAWGQGLAAAFAAAWEGEATVVAVDPDQTSFLPELQQTARAGAHALVVITFGDEGIVIVREAIAHELYDRFTFGDSLKSPRVVQEIGGDHLGGMYGTAGAADPASPSKAVWEEAYTAEYGGEAPEYGYAKETYDATVALALAAQAAGSVDGAAIRDRLRAIGSGPGVVVTAGVESIAAGLQVLAEGGEVNYEGAATTLDWDEHGDLRRGYIGVWRFTADEGIEEVEVIPFEAPAQ